MQYCSLQHLTLLSPSDTSVTGCPSCFGSASSCFLEVFLCSSLDILDTYQPRGFHLSVFYFFVFFMGFSRQECWSGLPFPSPVSCILSELSTKTHPSCVVLHGMAYSFIELYKSVIHVIILVSFLYLWFLFGLPSDARGLCKLPDGRDWLWGKLDLALVGRAMLSKSLIQLSASGWGCAPSL